VKQTVVRTVMVLAMAALVTPLAMAQSRPLVTEDPETVPAGYLLVEGGFDVAKDAVFPASGLTGNLVRIGTFGVSIGVSSIAEIQIDGGLRNSLTVTAADPDAPLADLLDFTGDTTSDFEDFTVGAKVKFLSETAGRPSMAIRFTTRLPNAGNESGLGLDTTDFSAGLAVGKTVQSVRIVGNFGFGILADPVEANQQNDVINYGASVARAIARGVELVGEFNGRWHFDELVAVEVEVSENFVGSARVILVVIREEWRRAAGHARHVGRVDESFGAERFAVPYQELHGFLFGLARLAIQHGFFVVSELHVYVLRATARA